MSNEVRFRASFFFEWHFSRVVLNFRMELFRKGLMSMSAIGVWMRCRLFLALFVSSLFSAVACLAGETTEGFVHLSGYAVDFVGDGQVDYVQLLGEKGADSESGFYRQLYLEITPGNPHLGAYIYSLPRNMSGFQPSGGVADFDGDGAPDLLVVVEKGAGMQAAVIVKVEAERAGILFNSFFDRLPRIRGTYRDNFVADLYIQESRTFELFSIAALKEKYVELDVYTPDGLLNERVDLFPVYYGQIELLRSGFALPDKLKVVVDVIGRYENPDRIAQVEGVLSYDGEGWRVESSTAVPLAE